MPSPPVIDRVEREFPGSKRWLEHPSWDIVDDAPLEIERLSERLSSLRPQVSSVLFSRPEAQCLRAFEKA